MAPDLNSVPPSPRPMAASPRLASRNPSRRASQQIISPTIPPAPTSPSLNMLPSNQHIVNAVASPTMTATGTLPGDNTGVGVGPGPLRHPRPLTAADLHLQLEKEQEAVVNRLTRELSLLRAAQNASVVSNASSTSTGLPDSADHNANHLLSGPSHPTPSTRRHHRSSSSTSTRSATGIASGVTAMSIPSTTADRTRGNAPRHESISMSRQNSMTGSRSHSPAPAGSFPGQEYYAHRPLPHREISGGGGGHETLRADSVTSVQTTGRYEEAAFHRHELEAVKKENELLKRRIRELERTLRVRRQSDASVAGGVGVGGTGERTRSESVSTTASVRDREREGGVSLVAAGRGRGRESTDREREKEDEESVQVGESARSSGIRR